MPCMHVVSETAPHGPSDDSVVYPPFLAVCRSRSRCIDIVIVIVVAVHRPCLIHPSCSYASVGVHTRLDLASSLSLCLCPWHCRRNPHLHGRDRGHGRLVLYAHFLQLSAPCSSPARRHYRCRWKSSKNPSRNHQARVACGRCSTPCCSSCPCPRCLPRPLPIVCLCVPAVLLVGGGCRLAHWGRHWFVGLFGCRVCSWVLRCLIRGVGLGVAVT
jgi:hypothetical protein